MGLEHNSVRALVARTPVDGAMSLNLEAVSLRTVRADEVLVKIVATGICHTDMYYAAQPEGQGIYPRVLGHEGKPIRTTSSTSSPFVVHIVLVAISTAAGFC